MSDMLQFSRERDIKNGEKLNFRVDNYKQGSGYFIEDLTISTTIEHLSRRTLGETQA
jgi:hypothetical protein